MPRRIALLLAMTLAGTPGCSGGGRALTIAVALLPSELTVYQSVLQEFEQENDLRVIVVPQQYADIRRALAAEGFAGSGSLDLVELDVYALALSAANVAELSAAGFAPELEALLPNVLEAGRIDGLRFLPHRVAWQALIYNHQELGRPPTTWEELLAVARRFPKRIGLKGALYEGLTCDLLPFLWAAGASGSRFEGPAVTEAFDWLASLAPYLHPQSATFKESTVAEAMARGEIVLHFNWPFVMSLYRAQGLAPGKIRSAPMPRGPHGRASVLGGGYIAIPTSTSNRAAAVRLARYLIGRHAQERFGRELGWFSPRRDVSPQDPDGLLAGFLAVREDVRPRPERPDYPRLSRLWQESFRAVAFGGQDPGTALAAAQAALAEN